MGEGETQTRCSHANSGAGEDAWQTKCAAGIAIGWLELDGRARLIVDSQLRPDWTNVAGRRLLTPPGPMWLHDGNLAWAATAVQRQFEQFVAALTAELTHSALVCPNGSGVLLLAGFRLDDTQSGVACIELARDQQAARARYHDLRPIFGLTRSEQRIITGLLNGRTAGQLASDQDVSVDTVRTHIRRIYSKVGAGSREEMFNRLRPYRIV